MPIVNVGTGGGTGTNLTTNQIATLDHFVYNPTSNRLEADREIQATLNSFFLGTQWKIASGGQTLVFTDLTRNLDMIPLTVGLLDQSVVANQDHTGVVHATVPEYGDMVTVESGPVGTGVIDYATTSGPFAGGSAFFGVVFVIEEAITALDVLEYAIHSGTDATAIRVFNQAFTGTAYAVGDTVTMWFDHALQGDGTAAIYTIINKYAGGEDGIRTTISVRDVVDSSTYWVQSMIRTMVGRLVHHRKPVIHSTGMPATALEDHEGGGEIRLEDGAVFTMDCAVLETDFQIKLVNTSAVDRTLLITNASSVKFHDGQPDEELVVTGDYSLVIEPNHTYLLSLSVVGTTRNLGINHLIDLTVPLDRAEQMIINLQTAEVMTMNLLFPPATGQNAFIISYPNLEGGYIFFDPQNTGNEHELIWPTI